LAKRRIGRSTERGLSLIEAMTSAAIFMIGVVALIGLHLSIATSNATANDISFASNIASAELELQQLKPYADVVGVHTTTYDRLGLETADPAETFFTATATGTVDPGGWYTDVIVVVSWTPSAGADPYNLRLAGRVRDPAR